MSTTRSMCQHLAISLLMLLLAPAFARAEATIKDTTVVMKTYTFSDPDPVPNPSKSYYPYFRFDGFTHIGKEKTLHMVKMENQYIQLTICPEVGGKVWGAIDKTTGHDFIYYNHVAKFRDIAMRGAWVSGGIEFNFGIIGHAPTSATPVDYLVRKNLDGSVSCIIGSYELITRTYWTVEVNLPANAAYFTTTTTWQNTSNDVQPYYQWMNAAYHAAEDAEMVYPGNAYIGHNGVAHTFPIDEQGRNLSFYKNTAFGADKSEHVLGYYNDYYGVYYHKSDYGSIHHSTFDDKFGQKIFTWSQSRQGTIWEDLLTDTDGQYIELQSGRMFNQPESNSLYTPYKHASFSPGTTDKWIEYWFPVNGIGGVSKASAFGAIKVSRNGHTLEVGFSPIVSGSFDVKIYDNDSLLDTNAMSFEPLVPQKVSLTGLGNVPVGNLKIIIGDNALVYTEIEDEFIVSAPKSIPADYPWDSARGLTVKAQQMLAQNHLEQAEKLFIEALEKDEWSIEAMNGIATVYVKQGKYDEALSYAYKALSINAYDANAAYLWAQCSRALGKKADAMYGFSIAARSPEYRSASYQLLAEMYMADKDWQKAIDYADKSLSANTMNAMSMLIKTEAYRQLGLASEATLICNDALDLHPLFPIALYEKQLLGGNKVDWKCELPTQNAIEAALWFMSIGNLADAIAIIEDAQPTLISTYLLAYMQHSAGNEANAKATLQHASGVALGYDFPFRPELMQVLTWAIKNTKDWQAKYCLALCQWANGQQDNALKLMQSLKDAPKDATFYLSRALLEGQLNQSAAQLNDLLLAEKIKPGWRTSLALMRRYAADEEWTKVVAVGQKAFKNDPSNYTIGLKLARGYLETGEYDKCLSVLQSIKVLPNEGAYEGRALYRAACLHKAVALYRKGFYVQASEAIDKSKEWPENLGVGRPYDVDTAIEDYLESLILSKQNDISAPSNPKPAPRSQFDASILDAIGSK